MSEKGFGIIELLMGILLAAIMGAAVASNLSTSLKSGISFELNYAAVSLANSKMELLAATSASSLDSSDNSTETNLTYPNIQSTFTRTTSIVVNSDQSRTVTVTVATSAGSALPTSVTEVSTYSIWQ